MLANAHLLTRPPVACEDKGSGSCQGYNRDDNKDCPRGTRVHTYIAVMMEPIMNIVYPIQGVISSNRGQVR